MRIAINGFGRIGRAIFRILHGASDVQIVATNDLTDNDNLAYLLRRDTVRGPFKATVELQGDNMRVDGHNVVMLSEPEPAKLPWGDLNIDAVVEATGRFRHRELIDAHLKAGATRVLLTVPPKDALDCMLVLGVNDQDLRAEHRLISNASCTTNCLAPLAKIVDDAFGIEQGFMHTIHAYTNNQALVDRPHKDPRRGRAAAQNMVPTTTGATRAVGKVLPQLESKLAGIATRVPVLDGSMLDFVVRITQATSVQGINDAVREASENAMRGIVEFSTDHLVSSDILGNPHSCVFDSVLTQQLEPHFFRLVAWYDNEWGYANRCADVLRRISQLANP